jgi:hypothetical protein
MMRQAGFFKQKTRNSQDWRPKAIVSGDGVQVMVSGW